MRVAMLLLALTSTLACRVNSPPNTIIRDELFFGLSRPDGTVISDQQWQDFVAQEITPRFPAGLCVIQTQGQYRDRQARIIREPGRMLILFYEDQRLGAKVDEVRDAYRKKFEQESVLRVTTRVKAEF